MVTINQDMLRRMSTLIDRSQDATLLLIKFFAVPPAMLFAHQTDTLVDLSFMLLTFAKEMRSLTHLLMFGVLPVRDTVVCAHCKEIFEKRWSDVEAKAELEFAYDFFENDIDDTGLVCDDCWERFYKSAMTQRPSAH